MSDPSGETTCSLPVVRRLIFAKLKTHQLPVLLVTVICFALVAPTPGVAASSTPLSAVCMTLIFFISGLKLTTSELLAAIRLVPAIVYGIVSILAITPILGAKCVLLLPESVLADEFKIGLALFFSMPCTISSGVVLAKQAGGNFALALLLTVAGNTLAVFTLPALLPFLLHTDSGQLDSLVLLRKLLLQVLLPLCVGKAVQYVKQVNKFAKAHGAAIGLLSNLCLALVPWQKVSLSVDGGMFGQASPKALIMVLVFGFAGHLVFLALNYGATSAMRLKLEAKKSIVVVCSQKTLPVALVVIALLPKEVGDQGLIALPCMISHLAQIVFDSFLVTRWKQSQETRTLNFQTLEETENSETATKDDCNEMEMVARAGGEKKQGVDV